MRRRLFIGKLPRLAVAALAAGLLVSAIAVAYFVATGSSTASATVGRFTAPAAPSATPGAGTVQLSWSPVSPPSGSGGVTYYVSRDGGAPSSGCPGSPATATAATSCTDTGLAKGTYTYTVTAVWKSWSATSSGRSVTVTSGALSKLVFTTQPDGSATGGLAFPQQPVVTAEDSAGNTVQSYASQVSLSIKSGTPGASLTCAPATASAGVASFSGCKIDKTGTYVLTATDGTLTVDSNSFTVSAGPATKLVFSTQPDGSATGGIAFPQQPVVTAQDAGGNTATSYTSSVSLSIKSGTAGATLTCTSVAASSGVATFSGCKIDKTGTYVLTATDGTRNVDSNSFTVSAGPATKLVFSTQPDGSATGGIAFPQQPVVTAQDAGGNTATSYNGTVTLLVKSGTGATGATLSGCTGTLSSGITTFSGCKIDKAGTGYILTAADGTRNVDSAAFNVSVGPVSQLVFTTQPDGSATGGVAFPQQPVVTAQDAGGNAVTSYSGTVALSIKSGTGTAGASLNGCTGSLSNGVTTFSGCKIDKAGTGYQLHASDGTLSADSATFSVSAGPATQLVFTTQPDGSATGGVAFPQQPVITARDAGGNTATGYAATISLSIKSGTGASGATLSGCTGTLSSGITTFSGCKIDKAGSGYILTASDGSLSVDSASFNIAVGPATQLVFSTQPDGSATAGSPFPQQPVVTARDAGGNTATGYAGAVTLSIKTGTGTSGASLTGCSGTLSNGVTTFSGCKIDQGGTGYVLTASDGTRSVDSAAFNITGASVSMIGQGAAKSSTISNVKSTNGSTDLVVIYCWGGTSCGSTGANASVATGTGTPFSSASTTTFQSILFSGSTKSCIEVIPVTGNGQTGTVTVSFSGGNSDNVGFVNVIELSPGATIKGTAGLNPAAQTSSTSATATLPAPVANSEVAIVGLDGNSGNDTITPPSGMTAVTPLTGFSNPESNSTIGFAGGNLGMYFAPAAQATSNFTLSPTAVDWGTIAFQVG